MPVKQTEMLVIVHCNLIIMQWLVAMAQAVLY